MHMCMPHAAHRDLPVGEHLEHEVEVTHILAEGLTLGGCRVALDLRDDNVPLHDELGELQPDKPPVLDAHLTPSQGRSGQVK